MLDRFKDAKWYIDHRTGVYGTLACGHPTIVADTAGHSCNRTGRQEDQEANARLIAASPDLLAAAKALLQRGPVGIESECHWCGREGEDTEHCSSDDCMGTLARAAIAKVEGRLVCQDGSHDCFNTDQPCGCRCDDCRDDTEPRCDICNGLINKYGSARGHCENESDHSGRA